jgi:DUF4097 and DUF4098 domain-containing protein YvlB
MKTTVIVLNIVFISLALCYTGFTQENEDQMTVSFSKPGEPGFIYVDNLNGQINIEGYEGTEIVVKAKGNENAYPEIALPVMPYPFDSEGDDEEISKEGLKKIKSSSFEINVIEEENKITIKAGSPMNVQNFYIKAPYNCSLKLNTVNGNISVKKITGEIEINTVNGKVNLDEISGSVVASSVNGMIKVTFKEVTPDAPMAFSTVNNHIDVTLPASVKATLKMKTDGGDIYTNFDMKIEEEHEKSQKEHKNAYTTTTTWAKWTTGKINGGGAELVFKSLHGDIHIRKGK